MNNAKLSSLQKCILVEASRHGEIQNADVLMRRYGFEPAYSYRGIKFSRDQIGMKRYLSATASTAKALTRLRDRRLLLRVGYGHTLTSDGRAVVEQMETANLWSP